jgi:hypothetical protein
MRFSRPLALAAGSLFVAACAACSSSGDDGASTTAATTTASTTTTAAGGSGTGGAPAGGSGGTTASGGSGGSGGAAPMDAGPDAAGPDTALCASLNLGTAAFASGPYGKHRGDVADDFTIDLADGTTYSLSAAWSGCEIHVFVPDTLVVSDLDPTSIWEKDLDKLVKGSPKNVHYVFVSRLKTDAAAKTSLDAMQARVDAQLAKMSASDAAHWKARLHVASKRVGQLGSWLDDVLGTSARIGMVIDRTQHVRGVGLFADVSRYDQALADAQKWPWKANLAYAANEAVYWNAQADDAAKRANDGAKVVDLWTGETLSQFAEKDVDLPTEAEMAGYDTLEVEVTSQCPNPDEIEFGNCGAWDYIASLGVFDDAQKNTEIARFITSYHRETHWVVDASDMLPLLAKGGTRHFRWDFAPEWNVQPTATKLSLRFSNRKKGARPTSATYLWSGGPFDSKYDGDRPPIDVDIPAGAKKVEVFAIVTGHGSGTAQCSEFCNHTHEITVGAST